MLIPVACSLRVAASPLKGAAPAAWHSQFRDVPGWAVAVRPAVSSGSTQRGNVTGMLRVEAVAYRRRAQSAPGRSA